MAVRRSFLEGLRGLFRRSEVEHELDEEIRDYLERATDEHERSGMNRESAERAARVEIGSRTAVKEEVQAGLWESSVLTFCRDLRYGVRTLRRAPGFSVVAILTLALGLGATTALLSVADAVLFKPLPVTRPEELVLFSWAAPPHGMPPISIAGMNLDSVTGRSSSSAFSNLAFQRFQTETRTLTEVFAFAFAAGAPTAPGLEDGPSGQLVTGNYFSALGTTPRIGRLLAPADDRENAPLVAVISYRYWQRSFAGDPAVVGKPLRFERFVASDIPGRPPRFDPAVATIVGVAPAGFVGTGQLGDAPDFFIPLLSGAPVAGNKFVTRMASSWVWPLRIMARMKPGVTRDVVQRELEGALQAATAEAWRTNPRRATSQAPVGSPQLLVISGSQGLMGTRNNLAQSVEMLGAIVAILLLIVCVNLANLLLARAEARRAEMAVRLAIGARRGRLVRQLVTETLCLTSCGALGGLVLARWAKDAALAWVNRTSPSFVVEPALDFRILALTAGLALVVAVAVGVIPALRSTRVDPNPALKEGAPSSSRARNLVGRSLLVAQVALALALVVAAGLFVRTLRNLQTADVGFNTRDLLLFRVNRTAPPPPPKDAGMSNPSRLFDRLAEQLDTLPGVQSAAFSQYSLLGGALAMPYLVVPGQPKRSDEDRTVYTQTVSPGFFDTMEMPILLGRSFSLSDRAAKVAIVNETLARRFFPETNAIGRRIAIAKDPNVPDVSNDELMEIVGVAHDAKYMTVREQALPTVFFPRVEAGSAVFAVRTASDPISLVPQIRKAVSDVSPDLVVLDFRTQTEQAALTFAEERHFAMLSSVFGALALVLTSIGLYGLLAYRVSRRTQEIGIRLALGASRAMVVRGVFGETIMLVSIGVVAGLGAASAIMRLVRSLLFGLAPADPISLVAAVAVTIVVAALAAVLPARRAARVDPLIALRSL